MEDVRLILIYGDSLSMPRINEHVMPVDIYGQRYANWYNQNKAPVILYNRSQNGLNIGALYGQYVKDLPHFEGYKNRVLMIQCGIVDCAPRPVPRPVRFLISKLPDPMRLPIVRSLHIHRSKLFNMGLSWRFTSLERFERIYRQWVREASSIFKHVFLIAIAPTTEAIERHSPGLSASIEAYNQIIAKVAQEHAPDSVSLVDVHTAIKQSPGLREQYISAKDGHHLTSEGHRIYFEELKRKDIE